MIFICNRNKAAGAFVMLSIALLISCNDNGGGSSSAAAVDEATKYPEGKKIYQKTCITCHQADGNGTPGIYPPLAKSDYLLADKNRAIRQVLKGSSVPTKVNGTDYTGMMPPQPLSDEEAAQVLNYVFHSWDNNGFTLSSADVKAVRDTVK